MKKRRQPVAAHSPDDALARYRARRDFAVTPEPAATLPTPWSGQDQGERDAAPRYVIQKHGARRLHYDLRLELDGVLLSWAVPKGPSLDPRVRRLAVRVEDHPLDYGRFEGSIPAGQYGAGRVIVWDDGHWTPLVDPVAGLTTGKLVFRLHGQKLGGDWELIRPAGTATPNHWLLFKKRDAWARSGDDYDVVSALPDSVITKSPRPTGPTRLTKPTAPADGSGGSGVVVPDLDAGVSAAAPSSPNAPRAADRHAARPGPLPDWLAPQLATLASRPPTDAGWIGEPKLDGYRLLARIEGARVQLFTRTGLDWTAKFPGIAQALGQLRLRRAWLDGEVTVAGDGGLPDFGALQGVLARDRTDRAVYFLFDILHLDGLDLRPVPLRMRRLLLAECLAGKRAAVRVGETAGPRPADRVHDPLGTEAVARSLRLCEAFDAAPTDLLSAATRLGLEGVMLKRADAPYREGRSGDWLKLKHGHRQDFVIIGYRLNAAQPTQIGALLLAYHEDGRLRAAGSVGTGWDARRARWLREQLEPRATDEAAVDPATIEPGLLTRGRAATTHWLVPTSVAEIRFAGWTREGHVRQAVFVGLRQDVPASEVEREDRRTGTPPSKENDNMDAQGPRQPSPGRARHEPHSRRVAAKATHPTRLTHPTRIVDPGSGTTKADLHRYYDSVAEWILPHLRDRPVALLRAPGGVDGKLFFQKHPFAAMPGVRELDAALWPDHEPMMAIDTHQALLSAVQMNVIELHTWNATVRTIGRPDRLVFDLDPGEGVDLPMLKDGGRLVRALLDELGLTSWIKTSGGKGLHIVVPIARRWSADQVKAFSKDVVEHLARVVPSHFVAKSGPSRRVGRIFVDYLRNGEGQTTVSAFSVRARPGLGVSMTIGWDELDRLDAPSPWHVGNARDHLSLRGPDPWQDYWQSRQSLTGPAKKLAASADEHRPGRR